MSVRILALDLAYRAAGLAGTHADDSDWPRLWTATVRPPDGGHVAVKEIHARIVIWIRTMRPDLAVIEDVFAGRTNPRTGLHLAELHGVIKHQLWLSRVPYVVVNPLHRAIYATGHARADKAAVLAAARTTYGHLLGGPAEIRDDNAADALELLALAADALGQPLADVHPRCRRAVHMQQWQPVQPESPRPAGVISTSPPAGRGEHHRTTPAPQPTTERGTRQ